MSWFVTTVWGRGPFRSRSRAVRDRRANGGSASRRPFESLEQRAVMDARVVITEVVTDNNQGLQAADGARHDWVELYNDGTDAQDLEGWYLTDDRRELTKWAMPSVVLHPGQYLVVFASGEDRQDELGNWHTNFRLNAEGEYLGLVEPDGRQIAAEFAPTLPAMLPDRSFGYAQDQTLTTMASSTAGVRVFVPTEANGGNTQGTAWTATDFDDTQWSAGAGGVGFGAALQDEIGLSLQDQLQGKGSSAWVRIPFTVAQPDAFFSLALRIKYNDGYAAYLNGQLVARQNSPELPVWNSIATASRQPEPSRQFETVEISNWLGALRQGDNVLAIHGLNRSRTSADFLINAELQALQPAPLGEPQRQYFAQPTPGMPNGLTAYAGLLPETQISVPHGFYEQPFTTTLSVAAPGATLVYTLDGSAPTLTNGTQVVPVSGTSSPMTTLEIGKTTTVRVGAFKTDFLPSRIDTQSYIFIQDVLAQDFDATVAAGFPSDWKGTSADYGMDPDVVGPNDLFGGQYARQIVDALQAAPTMSLVTDLDHLFDFDTGIYMNSMQSGFAWERPVSVEMIYPDGSPGFQENAGLRIQGENIRNLAGSKKQSMRLEFRSEYGATKLRFPVFGEDAANSFDTLILRAQSNDRWGSADAQYIRDQWVRSVLIEMGQPNPHGIFAHLYLNGFYWGVYNVVERPVASFASDYFGGDREEWDALNTSAVRDGTPDAWNLLRSEARKVKASDPQASNAAYLRLLGKRPDGTDDPQLETLLDVNNYIDYLIANFYGGNTDWPHKNYYTARRRGPESTGFKFFSWDAEKVLGNGDASTLETDQTGSSSGVADPYTSLRTNAEFRLAFADRVQRHFFPGGALYVDPTHPQWDPEHPERNAPASSYERLASEVALAMIGESARWGDAGRGEGRPMTVAEWESKRQSLMDSYFPRRSAIVLDQLRRAELYPMLDAPVFNRPGGQVPTGSQVTLSGEGTIYYTLDGTDPRQGPLDPGAPAVGVSPTAIAYAGPIVLQRGHVIKARAFLNGEWSALNATEFQVEVPALRIVEVMFNPRSRADDGGLDADEFEFVELLNVGQVTIDLQGIALTAGIDFVFSAAALEPGERVVVAKQAAAFRQRYGAAIPLAGEYGAGSSLSNGGETLRLEDSSGQLIQEFSFDDAWIPTADGAGDSLTIVRADGPPSSWENAAAWRRSMRLDGSPGVDDSADFNGDGRTDPQDVDQFCVAFRNQDLRMDLTQDGQVDSNDLEFLIHDLLRTRVGDGNLDGVFDSEDLTLILASGEYEDQVPGNSSWSEGDWNCDGDFTSRDIVIAFLAGMLAEPAPLAAQTAPRVATIPAERLELSLQSLASATEAVAGQKRKHGLDES